MMRKQLDPNKPDTGSSPSSSKHNHRRPCRTRPADAFHTTRVPERTSTHPKDPKPRRSETSVLDRSAREMDSGKSRSYLLDVVVAQGAAILELLTSEDKTLLIRGDTLLILDLGLDVVDGVARLDIEGNGLTREGLDETILFEKASLVSD
ncbi:uncharacterized protein BO97DRAFT_407388 [Aspergillus homomorphus CBS 101889]|uniref:Uncharacterized protein n=1 Tax=Aspergillus homomorphus (strain CBS 101889) TaxID=1450537 RepID=A0A395HPI1_ASPHC|nr:hypothetical protein BO97DRAFT_407388 [Aspergillus homomorphus CBS 101889]RAL09841.1 hypothetical protein BO97DRAFT_407388 [Aspergillus homomorphus CBS 101889]